MSCLGFKSVVYHGEVCLGELDAIPVSEQNFHFPNNEIRIHHFSHLSERCPPLSVLQTISSSSVHCKLESSSVEKQSLLINLHASCFYELKTAVVLVGDQEVHLAAMPSKEKKFPCFWCFSVPLGLYNSCLGMLNLRCLAIIFDLDETLVVANTMKSFEDRIDNLKAWIARENDPMRISGISAELKRYTDDWLLLKQYIDGDSVMDGGKLFNIQAEEVSPMSGCHEKLVRPVIRLQEGNIILTRIKPEIRDTSVLVRLRPAWEDLKGYLTARGRKRFEVYVCTMAERDYALEMWRLLDPDAHLIGSEQRVDRVVCVKSGSKKSISNIFQDQICHPKMAMIIDDRSKVWDDKDQSRVHVVPAFSPYCAPQAETASTVPVLCIARNVACNVRGGFFKEFDENVLRRISEIFYEDEVLNLPPAPDVSNYLMLEDTALALKGSSQALTEGLGGFELEQISSHLEAKNILGSISSSPNSQELRSEISQVPLATTIPSAVVTSSATLPSQKPSLLGAPIGRNLKSQLGQPARAHAPLSSAFTKPLEGLNNKPSVSVQEPDRQLEPQIVSAHRTSQIKAESLTVDHKKSAPQSRSAEIGVSLDHTCSWSRDFHSEAGKSNPLLSYFAVGVLQEIGRKCSSMVEFKSVASTSKDFLFSVEVYFSNEKIGVGMAKTRKDAQQLAAEDALRCLSGKYMAYIAHHSGSVGQDYYHLSCEKETNSSWNENGFLFEIVDSCSNEMSNPENSFPKESALESLKSEKCEIVSFDLINHGKKNRSDSSRLPQSVLGKRRSKESEEHA